MSAEKNDPEQKQAVLRPYSRHVLVCTGQSCADGRGMQVYEYLKVRIKELQLHQGSARIERSRCHCLGVCAGGPIAVVYPEGVWYRGVDESVMEKIIQEHLIQGRPVSEFILPSA